jgi:nitroreductase
MSGEKISDEELMTLFEAARWAPSSYNNQPWRFIYAKRETDEWKKLFDLMGDFNRSWTKNAAALIVVVSYNNFSNGKRARTHSFDTGAAWENLALQASIMRLVAHGMEGFDYEKAQKELSIPNDHTVECMIAIGRPGKKEDLPQELQVREVMSDRKPLKELVFHGTFKK